MSNVCECSNSVKWIIAYNERNTELMLGISDLRGILEKMIEDFLP